MTHRIWKETKQEPGTAGPGNMPGCCLVSLHFLCYMVAALYIVQWFKEKAKTNFESKIREARSSTGIA